MAARHKVEGYITYCHSGLFPEGPLLSLADSWTEPVTAISKGRSLWISHFMIKKRQVVTRSLELIDYVLSEEAGFLIALRMPVFPYQKRAEPGK